jgi:hypothetical protein
MKDAYLAVGVELTKLSDADYQASQDVHADDRQLRNLRKLHAKLRSVGDGALSDFVRCVSDVAGPTSSLSQLTNSLYESMKQ